MVTGDNLNHASLYAVLLFGVTLLAPRPTCGQTSQLAPKPEAPRPALWSYFIPSVGMQEGKPVVTFSLSNVMQAVYAWEQFKYADELRAWQEQRDALRAEEDLKELDEQRILLMLDLEKAEHDSLYAAKQLRITAARFDRGEVTDEQVLSAQNAVFQAAWTARKLREQIRQINRRRAW